MVRVASMWNLWSACTCQCRLTQIADVWWVWKVTNEHKRLCCPSHVTWRIIVSPLDNVYCLTEYHSLTCPNMTSASGHMFISVYVFIVIWHSMTSRRLSLTDWCVALMFRVVPFSINIHISHSTYNVLVVGEKWNCISNITHEIHHQFELLHWSL